MPARCNNWAGHLSVLVEIKFPPKDPAFCVSHSTEKGEMCRMEDFGLWPDEGPSPRYILPPGPASQPVYLPEVTASNTAPRVSVFT